MKFTSARIRNFKLLRSIDLEFAINSEKPLTVIRAENGSGKTSVLQAMRWALYGKNVLVDPSVRLSPADWPDAELCKISVEIDFFHINTSTVGGTTMLSKNSYMLKREVEEKPEGNQPNRGHERVSLYERTSAGSERIEFAESRLSQMLPKEMIDIFFTDGDAAMTFISPQISDKARRDKVKDAIRSLLGLELLECVAKRISAEQSNVNREISKKSTSNKLSKVSEEIEKVSKEKDQLSESVARLNEQIDDIQGKHTQVSRELYRALEVGSYENLGRQREQLKEQKRIACEEEEQLKRSHQELFYEESLTWALCGDSLTKGYDYLQSLHAKGDIPKTTIPVLEERLELEKCICGADLSEGSLERNNVVALIDEQRDKDSRVDYLSGLYYSAKGEIKKWQDPATKQWNKYVENLSQQRVTVQKRIENVHRELESVEAKLDQIDEEEIAEKRSNEVMYKSALLNKNIELDRTRVSLDNIEESLKELNREQNELSQLEGRLAGLTAKKTVLSDLEQVVVGALNEMQLEYRERVSERMNELFLNMVGADPEQGAIFQGAEIRDYSIIVNTTDGRTLNPDHEVNGASQRALTFAFIWALTEVSGVVAPRVIDTPLGMMSGNVKHRVLDIVSQPANGNVDRQVVLFLTQSEISHIEDILDERSGLTVTLIKTDDYPADLVNDPKASQSEVLLCRCTHREYCDQCQRTNHGNYQLIYRNN